MRGHIRKRGKSWAAVVYLGKDAAGKRRFKWSSFGTKREAEEWVASAVTRARSGMLPGPGRLTVAAYLERWLEAVEPALAPATRRSYQDTVRLHLTPVLGEIRLSRLAPDAIATYLAAKLREGLSATTVRYHARVLRGALQRAVRWGLLDRNPCEAVDLPRAHRERRPVWDEEQVRLFLAEARRRSPYYRLYLAALLTGMRQGELLGLRWEDVDFLTGTASVRRALLRVAGHAVVKEPKSGKARTVHLPPGLVAELRVVQDGQRGARDMLGTGYQDSGLIFCQSNGKPLHAGNITRGDFRRTVERAGVPRIRFHDLRHVHATLLLRGGAHPKVVQERLGHAGIAVTMDTYSHVLPGLQEGAAAALESRLLKLGFANICKTDPEDGGDEEAERLEGLR